MMKTVVNAVSVQNAVGGGGGAGADLKASQTGVYKIFNFKI